MRVSFVISMGIKRSGLMSVEYSWVFFPLASTRTIAGGIERVDYLLAEFRRLFDDRGDCLRCRLFGAGQLLIVLLELQHFVESKLNVAQGSLVNRHLNHR